MSTITTYRRLLVVSLVGSAASLGACAGCLDPLFMGQQHVFETPVPSACRTVTVPKKIDVQRAADILFMIDNSGSMTEEQTNLAANSSSIGGTGLCNTATAVQDLKTFMTTGPGRGLQPDQWTDPANGVTNGAQYKATFDDCGFIERLQLFDNDFQIGILASDMRDTDGFNNNGTIICTGPGGFPNGRQPLPQRGCLQPPTSGGRIIRPSDGDIATVASRFQSAVRNVGVCGSGIEEGLRNIQTFLTPGSNRAAANCATDYEQFLRSPTCLRGDGGACLKDSNGNDIMGPAPKLIIIILSDEEDCSTTNNPDGGPQTNSLGTSPQCYTRPEYLLPTSGFVDFLRNVKGDAELVSMAAIVGGTKDSNGNFNPGNCRCNGSAANAAPDTSCFEVRGNSISTTLCGGSQANAFCGSLPPENFTPATGVDGGAPQPRSCCTADRGGRFVDTARGMSTYLLDSICAQNYKSTMIDIANLINASDEVALGEVPGDIKQLVVEVKKTPNGEFERIDPWTGDTGAPEHTACNGCTGGGAGDCNDGYALVRSCTAVKFLGSDIPPEGAEIRISYLGASAGNGPKCQ